MASAEKHWSQLNERGSLFGIKILFIIYRLVGRHLLWVVLFPVVFFLHLTGKQARHASCEFFANARKVKPTLPAPSFINSLKHFCIFADSAFDKIDAWLGRITSDDIQYNDEKIFPRLIEQKKGAIFIGSHLGNLEVCRALSHAKHSTKINVLVFTAHAVKFNEMLTTINKDVSVNLIQVSSVSPTLAILLKEKVEQGEVIVIVGDRTSVTTTGRVEYVPFMKKKAPFSQGPFILASLLGCPVYWFFCLKEKKKFHVIFEHVSDKIVMPRKNRQVVLHNLVVRYAQRLEFYALRYPYQWFNFFHFWQKDDLVERD